MASNYQITVTLEGRDNLSDELRQVNQQLGAIVTNTANTSNSMTRMETAVSGLRTGFGNINGLLGQFGLGLSAMGIANAVTDLNDLGREAEAVETTFNQLSGGQGRAAQSLQNMRDLTGGVVDDMTLMRGANSLLLTGLASTNDQAAELVNLGYRLSAAMGVDATEGIQNLNAALLNNSFARLDTLGISAAAVRQRVEELKEEGYDMSEAFAQAVLEEGREKLERLGDAAATGETAFNRLSVSFQNNKARLAEFMATGIEAGSQLLEMFSLIQQHGLEDFLLAAQGGDVATAHRQQAIETRTQEIVARQIGFQPQDSTAASMGAIQVSGLSDADMAVMTVQARIQATQELYQEELRLAEQHDRLADASALAAERDAEWAEVEERRLANARAAQRANSTEQLILEGLGVAYDNLTTSAENFQNVGGIEIMSPEDAAAAVNTATLMQDWFDDLEQMAQDSEFQFISEDELANAEAMVSQANDLADQAERAAAAFEKMSLAQMMGTTGGGRLGELTDMVTGAIGDEGIAAQVELELDLRSGRTTELEQAFEDEFSNTIAQIAEQVGPEAAADAAQRALAALEQGQLLGMTDEQIAASVRGAIGSEAQVGFMGAETQAAGNIVGMAPVDMGGGGGAMPGAGAEAATPQDNLAAMGEQLTVLEEQSMLVSESVNTLATTDMTGVMDPFVHSFETADTAMNSITSKLDAVAGKSYRTTIAIDVVMNDPTGVGAAIMTQQMAQATQQNGGVAPGTAPTGTGPN